MDTALTRDAGMITFVELRDSSFVRKKVTSVLEKKTTPRKIKKSLLTSSGCIIITRYVVKLAQPIVCADN